MRRSMESARSVRLSDAMCLLVKPARIGIAISESAEDEAYSTSQNACKELPECCRSCPGYAADSGRSESNEAGGR